ncbi:hypothetical protein [Boseongicola sp. H5]|uniref:glycoside hydrolase family 38 N-terminal domain-containing protein n=1 Tax=Boseongicola sp. H5 TaxID=2763261 RepID=UPI001D09D0B2|nr:hypothetical protein [Boseongicola sp. H5]
MADRPITKLYLLSHTHTDFGYTDHVSAVRRHHRNILDRAITLCEESFDLPDGAQHRWTCELTSTTLDFLRHASTRQVDRFLALHQAGRIAVGALRYHWTPLVSRTLALRTLRDIDALRDEFGVKIRSAMQCDVNGLAWFWNDLLAARGITFLSTHQNPHRGYFGPRQPSLWHWENRTGGRILVHQGEHYGWGGNFLRLGRPGEQDADTLGAMLARHAASTDWPLDASVLTITNAANGDNAFPQTELPAAVQAWNARNDLQMEIVTLDQLGDILARVPDLPVQSGEWMDSWCDGVASSPLETAAARSAERLLPVIERLGPPEDGSFEELIDRLALYDEHTWGAHSAATAPDNIFATMQRIEKSSFAYGAFAASLHAVAGASRHLAKARGGGHAVEGDPGFTAQSHPELSADAQSYMVANPSTQPMALDWPVPFDRGAGPQIAIPQAYGCDAFFPGFGADGWTDAQSRFRPDGHHRLQAQLAPGEVRFLRPTPVETTGVETGPGWIETPLARIEICPQTGGFSRWLDKESGVEMVAPARPLLAPVFERMRPGVSRRDIFHAPYWERSERPMQWSPDPVFDYDVRPEISFHDGAGSGALRWTIGFPGRFSAELHLAPQGRDGTFVVTALQRTEPTDLPYSVHWPLRFAQPVETTLIDTGDGMIDALADHVPSSCLRWQCVQSGLGFRFGDGSGVAVAPLDTPLYQPGGPHWRNPHTAPETADGGTIWSINTHWDTNFPVRVTDQAPARFVLRRLPVADATTIGAALEQMSACPVIVRVPEAEEMSAGTLPGGA